MFSFVTNKPTHFGGNFTYGDLAEKFGWPAVIISTLMLPVIWVWGNLIAFPIWLPIKTKFSSHTFFAYPEHEDVYREKFYFSKKSVTTFPSGWTAMVDDSNLYECFWGVLINVLNCEITDHYFVMTPHRFSWIKANVFVEFSEAKPCHGHRLRFNFYKGGLNAYNPFCYLTIGFAITSIMWFSKRSIQPFMEEYGVKRFSLPVDELPDEVKVRADGSIPFDASLFDLLEEENTHEETPLLKD